ncbi:hypothetical protein GCM10009613_65690 [Pseudonocardia kongjuensis]|uniref:Uncharacterized protein n=1 Tax=Pseudonocardia kongjuensis TaxID=102227 RepID=A0ABN1YCD6_9PSEU
MPSPAEDRAAQQRAVERELLQAFGHDLPRKARQGQYAGIEQGEYVAEAIGAVFMSLGMHLRDLPRAVVTDALAAARLHLHGPSGRRDPRGNRSALTDGPGH